jgi:hypothetical protein
MPLIGPHVSIFPLFDLLLPNNCTPRRYHRRSVCVGRLALTSRSPRAHVAKPPLHRVWPLPLHARECGQAAMVSMAIIGEVRGRWCLQLELGRSVVVVSTTRLWEIRAGGGSVQARQWCHCVFDGTLVIGASRRGERGGAMGWDSPG